MEISEKDYNERLNAYLKEYKDKQPSNFFGAWSWYTITKGEFDKSLAQEGIVVRK